MQHISADLDLSVTPASQASRTDTAHPTQHCLELQRSADTHKVSLNRGTHLMQLTTSLHTVHAGCTLSSNPTHYSDTSHDQQPATPCPLLSGSHYQGCDLAAAWKKIVTNVFVDSSSNCCMGKIEGCGGSPPSSDKSMSWLDVMHGGLHNTAAASTAPE